MSNFWQFVLAALVLVLAVMVVLMFRKKELIDKLNYVFAMNTVIVLLILVVGFAGGREDMFIDIALSYSILGFVTSVILAKYIGGRKK
ncbi:MAG: pH regulation protein F [Alcaligenaceae bacterium]|nr:pH regulation protein F [Alcaligenaceae bacterium]